MDNQESQPQLAEQFLIEDVIFYGVLQPQKLSIQNIKRNNPKVGVIMHFCKGSQLQEQIQHQELQMWAYPDGIKIFDHHLQIINDPSPQFSFGKQHNIKVCLQSKTKQKPADLIYSFVHTDYSLNRTYFSALCWHESRNIPLKNDNTKQFSSLNSSSLPKCTLGELEQDPHLISGESSLVFIPQLLIVGSSRPIFSFQRDMLKLYYRNVIAETSNPVINLATQQYFQDLVQVAGYHRAEVYFDAKQSYLKGKQKEYQQVDKKYLQSFYTSFFFLPRLTPTIGSLQVLDCSNSSARVNQIYLQKQCFEIPNIDILGIMRKVGLNNFVDLWKNLILQKHILVFSMNNNAVIDLFQSLLYLLQPIRWENIYIPFLPFHLINNIEAIQSYLIGISKIHMDYVIEQYQHKVSDLVLFDLDQNILIQKTNHPAELPIQIRNTILERMGPLGFRKDSLLSFSFFNRSEEANIPQTDRILMIKMIFFDALIYLLNNYRPFASLKNGQILNFDRQGYKNLFRNKNEWVSFAEQLTETMIFTRLCQYHLYQEKILRWNQSNLGGLFVYCQNILSNCNPSGFWDIPSIKKGTWKWDSVAYYDYIDYVFTQNIKTLKAEKKIYALENYLIKYLSWVEMDKLRKLPSKDRNRQLKSVNIYHCLLQFIFPWIKQIQQPEKQGKYHVLNTANRLKVVNLSCLFDWSTKFSLTLEKEQVNIEDELKAYRELKHSQLRVNIPREKINARKNSRKREDRMSV